MSALVPTPIDGSFLVEMPRHGDERGWLERVYDRGWFADAGIDWNVVQASTSFNPRKGTLRGLHYQIAPAGEPKLVCCTRGEVFDVAVDLRSDSETYCRWHAVRLGADEGVAVYIPPGCAHGFLTIADSSELLYLIGEPYVAELSRGVRWDDPAFGIEWPFPPSIISARDRAFPLLDPLNVAAQERKERKPGGV